MTSQKSLQPPLPPSMFKQSTQQRQPASTNIQTIYRPNGAIYKGEVKDGQPHGRGIMTYKNGQRYQGEFLEGNKNGKGKYYYIKGELYIGDWKNNVKDGFGQYFYENGTRYTGEFLNNMKHGNGRLDEENGTYYEGLFYMNNKDKTGLYFDAFTNKKFMHVYENGKLVTQRQIMEEETELTESQKKINEVLGLAENRRLVDIVSQAVEVGIREHDSGSRGNNFNSQFPQSLLSLRNSIKNFDYNTNEIESGRKKKLIAENYFQKDLLDKKINEWTSKQVSEWLSQIGFGDCIEDFRENNIEGDSLLFLANEDLKELGISALGDRRIMEREIGFLKLIFKSQCLGDTISKLRNKKLTFDVIEKIQQAQLKQENKERGERNGEEKSDSKSTPEKQNDGESSSSDSSSDSEKEKEKQQQREKENRQKKKQRQREQNRPQQNMQTKIETYMAKKGIKLNFLIPKEQIEIIEPIGKGGYGQVYLGKWLGQQVAVKKYLKKKGFRNKHIGHFIEEVQVINKLLHPSIVLYMGMCIDDNEYDMVTEFLSGGSLFDYLHKKNGKLSEEQILEIMMDVALGMSYLHGKNVLHCDLKSSNVLIDENWNVKLCDFGLSRINTRQHNRKRNIRVGTPHWMAPQILKGEKYQCYSDVYSFGILVWQMITGKIPYKDLSTAQIIGLVGNNPNHHISIPKYGNEYVLKIFLICTERDPHKRPTFKFIVSELETALEKFYAKAKEVK